jgi:mannose-1-phosphate guanylyltransferase
MQRNSKRKFKAIILAGGNGERFWPLSTARRPKQFLKVFCSESLIRQSVSRVSSLVTPKDTFVIMSKHLVKTTIKELPEIPVANNVVKLMTTPLSDDLRQR